MSDEAPPLYTLAIPETDQTQELSRREVLDALASGRITRDHWAWSSADQDWKQLSSFPEFHPPVTPVVTPLPSSIPPSMASAPVLLKESAPVPKGGKKKKAESLEIPEEPGSPYLKVIFGGIFLIIVAIIGLNYFLVDRPLEESLAQTPFVLIPAHAQLGGLVQPQFLVIHIFPNPDVTVRNFADLLSTLASDTPPPLLAQYPFQRIDLTSGLRSQYSFNAADWKKLGEMKDASDDDRKALLSGGKSSDNPQVRDRAWHNLLNSFVSNP
jgi:hypothetical protein